MNAPAVQEFKDLVLKHYGIVLSDAEALEQAGRFLLLYKTVYGAPWTDTPDADQNQKMN